MADSVVHTPFPTGSPWLARALVVSAVLHALAVLLLHVALAPADDRMPDIVDIEIAPAPPKAEALPAEHEAPVAKPGHAEEPSPAAIEPKPPAAEPGQTGAADAGVDAAADAGGDAPADAAIDAPRDAGIDASRDAGIDAPRDAAPDAEARAVAVVADAAAGSATVTTTGSGTATATGSASATATGSATTTGPGVPAALALSAGSGAPGMTDEPAVSGAPTTAGTAANLLAYFPAGQVVSALIRFDRLRGTEWAAPTERVLQPLPDYRVLFGTRSADLADRVDTLVISTPRPHDASATTLVIHTAQTRAQIRDFLANPAAPITWQASRGGMLGRRRNPLFANDHRAILSPWRGWVVLASPADLGGLEAPARGDVDTIEARGPLPPWLDAIRSIEKESGDGARGPALIVTFAGDGQRHALPDVGLGVTSLPAPERATVAVEIVPQGWLVRGNLTFANEADAAELVQAVQHAQQRIADSRLLSLVLRQQHVLAAITGLSLARTGARVSYATSASIADARAVLAGAAAMLDRYFAGHGMIP